MGTLDPVDALRGIASDLKRVEREKRELLGRRLIYIAEAREAGVSITRIAAVSSLTRQRVQQITSKIEVARGEESWLRAFLQQDQQGQSR